VHIPDLRAGFCQLIAAVLARGCSTLSGAHHIDRGYERIDATLASLGACIERRGVRDALEQESLVS
jgi:UDP-N-acetylglucosamine 1-carboxyvinyltransferase